MKGALVVGAIAVSSALATLGCRAGDRPAGTLVVGVAVAPNNLDPRIGSDEASQRIHQLVFNGLAALDDDLRVVPELATSWTTPDDRTYVVDLRRGVRFHDGAELTSADVAYTFRSFLDPGFVSARKGAYRLLESVEPDGQYRVVFRLKEAFASFPVNLVMGIVRDGAREVAANPIGTGPFRFVRQLADDRVELEAFDGCFQGAPRARRLIVRTIPDDTMRGLELRTGAIDLVVNDFGPDLVHQLQREPQLALATHDGVDYAYVGINLKAPPLDDLRVRQALALAIDRRAIVDHLRRGLARPAVGILPPSSWAFDADVPVYECDLARAAALLEAAGFPDPDGAGPRARLHLSLKTSNAEFVRLQAAVLMAQLKAVDVDLDVRTYEFATLYADVLRGSFELFTLQWVGVTDPDMLRRVFHSSQMPPNGFNRGFFSDPAVDDLIDTAGRTADEDERRRLYADAQRRIAEAVPYISLWYKTNVAVYRRSLDGVVLSPTASFAFLRNVEPARATPGD